MLAAACLPVSTLPVAEPSPRVPTSHGQMERDIFSLSLGPVYTNDVSRARARPSQQGRGFSLRMPDLLETEEVSIVESSEDELETPQTRESVLPSVRLPFVSPSTLPSDLPSKSSEQLDPKKLQQVAKGNPASMPEQLSSPEDVRSMRSVRAAGLSPSASRVKAHRQNAPKMSKSSLSTQSLDEGHVKPPQTWRCHGSNRPNKPWSKPSSDNTRADETGLSQGKQNSRSTPLMKVQRPSSNSQDSEDMKENVRPAQSKNRYRNRRNKGKHYQQQSTKLPLESTPAS